MDVTQLGVSGVVAAILMIGIAYLWRAWAAERQKVTDLSAQLVKLTEQALAMGEKNQEILPEMRRTVDANTDVMRELAMQTVRRGRG